LFLFSNQNKKKKTKEKGKGILDMMCITNYNATNNGSKCNEVIEKKKDA
jgi:hypothetical protein